jgi:hypothetical protein
MEDVFALAARMMRPQGCRECGHEVYAKVGQRPVCLLHFYLHVFHIALSKSATDYWVPKPRSAPPRTRLTLPLVKALQTRQRRQRNATRYEVQSGKVISQSVPPGMR